MARTLAVPFAIVVGIVVLGAWTQATQAPRTQCTVLGKGDFDAGWVEKTTAGVSYRCVPTYNAAFAPTGASWVRVNGDGTIGATLPR
jgi:hypothetical protein